MTCNSANVCKPIYESYGLLLGEKQTYERLKLGGLRRLANFRSCFNVDLTPPFQNLRLYGVLKVSSLFAALRPFALYRVIPFGLGV